MINGMDSSQGPEHATPPAVAHVDNVELFHCPLQLPQLPPPEPEPLKHYRCTKCFGIVGTEAADKSELTCICGGKLRDLVNGQ